MNSSNHSSNPQVGSCSILNSRALTFDDLYPQQCKPVLVVVYGTVVPALAILVTVMDLIIISIFVKPHIRSHTSFILTLIAIADSLNIICPSIGYVYYFTLGHFLEPIPFWFCRWTYYLSDVFSRFFNMLSLWFTVLLASIRYGCIKSPLKARSIHNRRNIICAVVVLVLFAFCVHIPTLFLWDFQPLSHDCHNGDSVCTACVVTPVFPDGHAFCTYRKTLLWVEIITNSFLPCALLIFLDVTILIALQKAEASRSSLRRSGTQYGKHAKQGCDSQEEGELKTCITSALVQHGSLEIEKPTSMKKETRLNDEVSEPGKTSLYSGMSTSAPLKQTQKKTRKLSFRDEKCCSPIQDSKYNNHTTKDCGHSQRKLSVVGEVRRKAFFRSRQCHGSVQSSDSAVDRLNQECRRTSRLILLVVTIISTHEIPLGIIRCHALATNDPPLAINMFGCASVFLSLWQYVTYPLIFLIYCCMSSAFREEMWTTLTCGRFLPGSEHAIVQRKNVFMSPCSMRRTLSRGTDRFKTANQKTRNSFDQEQTNDEIDNDDELEDIGEFGND